MPKKKRKCVIKLKKKLMHNKSTTIFGCDVTKGTSAKLVTTPTATLRRSCSHMPNVSFSPKFKRNFFFPLEAVNKGLSHAKKKKNLINI